MANIDLVMLDSDTAGCIQTYLANDHQLDMQRIAILGRCYHDLYIVNQHLKNDALDYFQALEELAGLVLEQLSSSSTPG